MMNKKKISQMAKRILHPHTGLSNQQMVHPKREWFTGLLISLIIFGGAGVWSVRNYTLYSDISIEGKVDPEDHANDYRGSLVDATIDSFTERVELHEELVDKLKSGKNINLPIEEKVIEDDQPDEVIEEENQPESAAEEVSGEDIPAEDTTADAELVE